MRIEINRLGLPDLPAALAIQSEIYPIALVECPSVFSNRTALSSSYCLAARIDGQLVGYLIAHGWRSNAPPPLGAMLTRSAIAEVLYIHDPGVSPTGRGAGLGSKLVDCAITMAASDGLHEAQLIAVHGAEGFWRGLGFSGNAIPSGSEPKLRSYGADSVWMTRAIG